MAQPAVSRTTDPRTQRSKGALQRALIELTVEQGLAATTVEDLTVRAGLGRTTFYLHYADKDALMLECIDAIIDALQAEFTLVAQDPLNLERGELLRLTFAHVAKHAELYRFATHSDVAAKVNDLMAEKSLSFTQRFLERTAQPSAPTSAPTSVPTPLIAHHLTGSLLATIRWWLESGQDLSADEVATLHIALIMRGLGAFGEG